MCIFHSAWFQEERESMPIAAETNEEFKEDWQLSQFWYSQETAEILARYLYFGFSSAWSFLWNVILNVWKDFWLIQADSNVILLLDIQLAFCIGVLYSECYDKKNSSNFHLEKQWQPRARMEQSPAYPAPPSTKPSNKSTRTTTPKCLNTTKDSRPTVKILYFTITRLPCRYRASSENHLIWCLQIRPFLRMNAWPKRLWPWSMWERREWCFARARSWPIWPTDCSAWKSANLSPSIKTIWRTSFCAILILILTAVKRHYFVENYFCYFQKRLWLPWFKMLQYLPWPFLSYLGNKNYKNIYIYIFKTIHFNRQYCSIR